MDREGESLSEVDKSVRFVGVDNKMFVLSDSEGGMYYIDPKGSFSKDNKKIYIVKLINTVRGGSFNNVRFFFLEKKINSFSVVKEI